MGWRCWPWASWSGSVFSRGRGGGCGCGEDGGELALHYHLSVGSDGFFQAGLFGFLEMSLKRFCLSLEEGNLFFLGRVQVVVG